MGPSNPERITDTPHRHDGGRGSRQTMSVACSLPKLMLFEVVADRGF